MELKPCPFCGSKNVDIESNGQKCYWGCCNNCQSEGPLERSWDKAAEVWNIRAE